MLHIQSLKIFIFLTILLNIQSTFAMLPERDEEKNCWWNLSTASGLQKDEKQKKNIPPPKPFFPRLWNEAQKALDDRFGVKIPNHSTPFFQNPEIPADLMFNIISRLCEDKSGVENLSAISRTCTAGYHLSQNSDLWEILRNTYASHLPLHCVEWLTGAKDLPPLGLARVLLRARRKHQEIEMNRLCNILSDDYHPTEDYEGWVYSLADLPDRIKKGHRNLILGTYRTNKKTAYSEAYWNENELLDLINDEHAEFIIKNATAGFARDGVNRLLLDFQCAITRLTAKGIGLIKSKITDEISRDNNLPVRINLSRNYLQYIPDDLFSVGSIQALCLHENPLPYIHEAILNTKDTLTALTLGEVKQGEEWYTPPVPSFICQLTNLTYLEIKGNNIKSHLKWQIEKGFSDNFRLKWEGEYIDGTAKDLAEGFWF